MIWGTLLIKMLFGQFGPFGSVYFIEGLLNLNYQSKTTYMNIESATNVLTLNNH